MKDISSVNDLVKITIVSEETGKKPFEKFVTKEDSEKVYSAWKDNAELDGQYLEPGNYALFMNTVYISFDGCLEQGDNIRYDNLSI